MYKICFCITILISNSFILLAQNFVGLSVSDGYIACGSETNEVNLFNYNFKMTLYYSFQVYERLDWAHNLYAMKLGIVF